MSKHLARPNLLVVTLNFGPGTGRVPQGARETGDFDRGGYDGLAGGFESGDSFQWPEVQS